MDNTTSLNQQFLDNPSQFLKNHTLVVQDGFPQGNAFPQEAGTYAFTLIASPPTTPNGLPLALLQYVGPLPSSSKTGSTGNIPAYWMPQGGYVDIPVQPAQNSPKTVFTPNLDQATLYIDQYNNEIYRAYHVEAGQETSQYTEQYHGLGKVNEMKPADYGTASNTVGFAVLVYNNAT